MRDSEMCVCVMCVCKIYKDFTLNLFVIEKKNNIIF